MKSCFGYNVNDHSYIMHYIIMFVYVKSLPKDDRVR